MRRAVVHVGVLLALGGCSLAVVTGPRGRPPVHAPACHTSRAAPLLDATAALAAGVGSGAAAIAYHGCSGERCGLRADVAATSLLAALVLGVSASYGFSTAHLCREAEAAHAAYVSRSARP
ncbi:MAG TPA: hypothetical protein VMZ28_01280 [Kofleriaceae bacterium]|nr:hypothetical protein [Kofleriaceae bacterium]